MGSIGRYIFRTTFGAFLVVLVSLTAVIWVTQALRDIDLMTNQGQTILVFVGITGLIIPLLILVIAPIALVIAVAHMLNKLGTDSEIIVMNAAGMSPWRLFRPFLAVRPSFRCWSRRSAPISRRRSAAAAALADRGAHRPRHQYRAAGTLHLDRARADLPHPRAASERPPARHLPRRPARPEGTRDGPRRAGRDPEERARHVPGAGERQRAAAEAKRARSDHRAVRQIRASTCRASPAARKPSAIRCASDICGS